MADNSLLSPGDSSATSDDTTLEFVIEQTTGSKRKVTLAEHDAPFGAARKGGMFNLGGKNERTVVRLDGRQSPIIHTKFTVWEPAIVKGHLRDHFTGVSGHGQQIISDLQDILDDQLPVTLTCGQWTWTAFPDEFKLPVEGLNDFTYELRFEILSRPGQKPPPNHDDEILPYPTDFTAEMQSVLAEQRATLLAQQIAADVQIALATMMDALDTSLDATVVATTAFENADLPGVAQALSMGAAAQQVSSRCDDVSAELESLAPADALTATGDDSIAAWQAQQFAMLSSLDECRSRMWKVRFTANKRVRSVSRPYKVAPGDTIDSVAREQLGSAARASDLNLRQQDLVVGRTIRIPKT